MKRFLVFLLGSALFAGACKKSDPALPDNQIAFTASTQGLATADNEINISLNLSRATDVAIPVVVNLQASNVVYGTHFTTTPAVGADGKLSLTIPAGSSSVSFKVSKVAGIFLNGTESLTFTLASAGSPIILGGTKELKLSFSSITSTGSSLTLQGGAGGSAAVNSVYVDLSANAQSSVARASWDLGFYSGTDFRVIINNVNAASVVAVNKTDINAVTAADVTLANLALGFGSGTYAIMDNVDGDLTKTAIPAISATDADNKVYVINRAGGAGATPAATDLYKVRILRAANGYTLQYAKLSETTFKTATITKNAATNFNFVNIETGAAATVEPAKDRWDFVWTYSIYKFDDVTPYAFSDLVFTNYLGGTTAAEVVNTATLTYATYAEANIATTTFVTSRNTIGSNWRVTSPAASAGVKTDRFYVVKDSGGNVYKLKFKNFITADGGTRGYPQIEYALVKKGN